MTMTISSAMAMDMKMKENGSNGDVENPLPLLSIMIMRALVSNQAKPSPEESRAKELLTADEFVTVTLQSGLQYHAIRYESERDPIARSTI